MISSIFNLDNLIYTLALMAVPILEGQLVKYPSLGFSDNFKFYVREFKALVNS